MATTARDARLRLKQPGVMIEAEARRKSPGATASFGHLGPGPLRLATSGKAEMEANATFLVALTPGGSSRLRFTIEKHGPGRTVVVLENLNRRPAQFLKMTQGTGRRRSLVVETGRVAARGPVPGTEPLPPQVLAFYYMWYGLDDWNGGKPIAGYNLNPDPYASGDPAVIDRHIQQARDAGIEGFIVSWHGAGSETDGNLKTLVERLPAGFSFAIYLEILNPGFGSKQELISQIDYALDTYAASERYLTFQGRPVVYAFATRHVFQWPQGGIHPRHLDVWSDVLEALARRGHHPFLIGEGRHFDPENFAVFHGMHAYGTEDPAGTFAFNRKRSLIARSWAAVHGGPRRTYGASIIPGYDDTHIAGRFPIYHFPRENGALYAAQWAAATNTGSDQALIVSFNEWPETSNIEPNEAWGEQYLDLTALYAAQFKLSRE